MFFVDKTGRIHSNIIFACFFLGWFCELAKLSYDKWLIISPKKMKKILNFLFCIIFSRSNRILGTPIADHFVYINLLSVWSKDSWEQFVLFSNILNKILFLLRIPEINLFDV